MRNVVLSLLLAATVLGGCAESSEPIEDPVEDVGALLFAGPSLYADPQNAAHPAFNWPTMANPANGTLPNKYWAPSNATEVPSPIQGLDHVIQSPGIRAGAGIAIFGSIAVVPGYGAPTHVVDISDPTDPTILSSFESQISNHRGATIIAYPDGDLITVISTGGGLDVWDITNVTDPQPLGPITEVKSHKVGVVPGTPIVYNARSDGGNNGLVPGPGNLDPDQGRGIIEMFDFTDKLDPVRLPDFENGYGCHHIYFWNNVEEDKFRAICAGIEYTQIIDTADPYDPKVIVSVPYGHGVAGLPSGSASIAAFSHYAGMSLDGKVLMVGDESGGGIGPVGCVARVDTPAGAVSVPIGAVWFYDISDETDPRYIGHISADQLEKAGARGTRNSCTAHHGRLVPVEGRDVLAMSFYGAGVIVVDFTDIRRETPGLPTVLAQFADGSNTWETWYYNGYLFTGDLARGMDVLKFE